jgi:large repetitive protein
MSKSISSFSLLLSLVLIGCREKADEFDLDNDGFNDQEDCDDSNASINPSSTDLVGDDIDQNCDGIDGVDADGDGLASLESNGSDCDDTDADIEASSPSEYYADQDGDGYGAANVTQSSCEIPTGYVEAAGDCDDSSGDINPGAVEVCDGIDNDCDETIDDEDENLDVSGVHVGYEDLDGDGYGNPDTMLSACDLPEGLVDNGDDCNDDESSIYPLAEELVADGVDSNCDSAELCYTDADNDGYGDETTTTINADADGLVDCTATEFAASQIGDCDDSSDLISPDATEVCDGLDNDCDGDIDDDDSDVDSSNGTLYYADYDGDGYGDDSVEIYDCDGDGPVSTTGGDCNDSSAVINPLATDLAGDAIDQNCDGVDGIDIDGDGVASVISGGQDCDDADFAINPSAAEICDGIDNDCDGDVDDDDSGVDASSGSTYYSDSDGDSYGDPTSATVFCNQPLTGYVVDSSDCDDGDGNTYPGAAYLQDPTECLTDTDGDGWSSQSLSTVCYSIEMNDTWGDGWNGNSIEIWEDGVEVSNFTLLSGSTGTDSYCPTTPGATIDFVYYQGFYPSEVSYILTAPDGTELLNETLISGGYSNGDVMYSDVFSPTSPLDTDCDDSDATISPDATEVCDEIDNNCDGTIDEGLTQLYYTDSDGDGYGDPNNTVEVCAFSSGMSSDNTDCDDTSGTTYPGVAFQDSLTDCMADFDGDGFGDLSATGSVVAGRDCNDLSASINPYATDIVGDTYDQNCDGIDGTDSDGDGFASLSSGGDDCDDADPLVSGNDSDGDGLSSCDGDCDDNDPNTIGDDDNDGYFLCVDDCDDSDVLVNPSASEVYYDGIDQNCDGLSDFDADNDGDDASEVDCDGDGVAETSCDLDGDGVDDFVAGNDCDDSDPTIEGLDSDGDGITLCIDSNGRIDCDDTDAAIGATDNDTDGYLECVDDCNDSDLNINPSASEIYYDGVDQNCDGRSDFDADNDGDDISSFDCDGDGFPDTECDMDNDGVNDFYVGTDCDDSDNTVNGTDLDGDGISSCEGDCDDTDSTSSSCPIGSPCSSNQDCDTNYCGIVTNTCVELTEVVLSALDAEYSGDLGGISGANSLCSSQAATYGHSGEWVALLSTSTQNAIDLVPNITNPSGNSFWSDVNIIDINGSSLLSSWNSLTSNQSLNLIVTAFNGNPVDEGYGYSNDADAWTGSDTNGTVYSNQTCNDWTSSSSSVYGVTTESDAKQVFRLETNKTCNTTYAVQCLRVEP